MADLSGANLAGACLAGAQTRATDCRGADLSGADLGGAFLGELLCGPSTKLEGIKLARLGPARRPRHPGLPKGAKHERVPARHKRRVELIVDDAAEGKSAHWRLAGAEGAAQAGGQAGPEGGRS
jgi:uncharacterized protein YjbI with pentapeptide repeats